MIADLVSDNNQNNYVGVNDKKISEINAEEKTILDKLKVNSDKIQSFLDKEVSLSSPITKFMYNSRNDGSYKDKEYNGKLKSKINSFLKTNNAPVNMENYKAVLLSEIYKTNILANKKKEVDRSKKSLDDIVASYKTKTDDLTFNNIVHYKDTINNLRGKKDQIIKAMAGTSGANFKALQLKSATLDRDIASVANKQLDVQQSALAAKEAQSKALQERYKKGKSISFIQAAKYFTSMTDDEKEAIERQSGMKIYTSRDYYNYAKKVQAGADIQQAKNNR